MTDKIKKIFEKKLNVEKSERPEFGGDVGSVLQRSRLPLELRLNNYRQKEEEERQRKLIEIDKQRIAMEKLQQLKIIDRNKRLEEIRNRDHDHRLQVIDRKQKLIEADLQRKEAILRRNEERDARVDSFKKKRAASGYFLNQTFAFGSSTPRLLDRQFDTNSSFWNQKRSTSINSMCMSTRNSAICNRINSSKKQSRPTYSSSTRYLNNSLQMSSSMYEVFNWNENLTNHNVSMIEINHDNDVSENDDHKCTRVIRRRTDLVPTISLCKNNSQSTLTTSVSNQALKSVSTSQPNRSLSQPNAKLSKQRRPKSTAISGITLPSAINEKLNFNANFKQLESNLTNVATNPTQTSSLSNKSSVNGDNNSNDDKSHTQLDNSLMNQNVKIRINTKQEAQAAIAERRRLIREESLKQKQVDELIEMSPIKIDGGQQFNQTIDQINVSYDDVKDNQKSVQKSERDDNQSLENQIRQQSEQLRLERVERLEKEEQEREARRKRVEAIMLRTRSSTATATTTNIPDSSLVSTTNVTVPANINNVNTSICNKNNESYSCHYNFNHVTSYNDFKNEHNNNNSNQEQNGQKKEKSKSDKDSDGFNSYQQSINSNLLKI